MKLSLRDLNFLLEIIADEVPLKGFLRGLKDQNAPALGLGPNVISELIKQLESANRGGLNRQGRKHLDALLEDLRQAAHQPGLGNMARIVDELKQKIENEDFGSIEEANAFLQRQSELQNDKPIPELGNASPNQLNKLFEQGWWKKGSPISLTESIDTATALKLPLVNNIFWLIKAIFRRSNGVKGAKATETGNLPRIIVDAMAVCMDDPESYSSPPIGGKTALSEDMLPHLGIAKKFAEKEGYIDLYHGHWQCTQKGLDILTRQAIPGLPAQLFDMIFREAGNDLFDDGEPDKGYDILLSYMIWRLHCLKPFKSYGLNEITGLISHPNLLEWSHKHSGEENPLSLAADTNYYRLFLPLLWLGCMSISPPTGYFLDYNADPPDIEDLEYRITPFFHELVKIKDLPTG